MGYEPNNNYILENDVEEANNPSFEKEMKRAAKNNNGLPEGYDIEESSRKKTVQEELQEAAEAENLVANEDYLGGEGASHEEVIDALLNEEMSEGAKSMNSTSAAISDLSSKVHQSIQKIGQEIDQFKVQ